MPTDFVVAADGTGYASGRSVNDPVALGPDEHQHTLSDGGATWTFTHEHPGGLAAHGVFEHPDDPRFWLHAEWLAEAERRFGTDPTRWRFRCPRCGHVASGAHWKAAGFNVGRAPAECIGRAMKQSDPRWDTMKQRAFDASIERGDGPCDWAAFGLLSHPETVYVRMLDGGIARCFPFADPA